METENFLKAEPVANAEATERVNVTNAQDGVSETDHVLPVAGGADDEEGPSLPEIREELRRLREENEALESRNASLEEESVRLEKRAELMRSELEEIRPIAEAGLEAARGFVRLHQGDYSQLAHVLNSELEEFGAILDQWLRDRV